MVKWKPHLGKKLLLISSEWNDAHISNFPRSKRTLKHMCGAKITARGSCVHKIFKVFQMYSVYPTSQWCGISNIPNAQISNQHSSSQMSISLLSAALSQTHLLRLVGGHFWFDQPEHFTNHPEYTGNHYKHLSNCFATLHHGKNHSQSADFGQLELTDLTENRFVYDGTDFVFCFFCL